MKRIAQGREFMIALVGILIGIAGEILPSGVQESIESYAHSLGISYWALWLTGVGVLTALFLGLSLKGKVSNLPENQKGRLIQQKGNKSIYIEKNQGDIHIQ